MRTIYSPFFRFRRGAGLSIALAAIGAFGATVLAPSDAAASGYLTARFGTDHGTPASPNTYAVYYNPAALGGTTGTTITGDVSVTLRWASYQRTEDALSPSDPASKNDPNYVAANTGKANLLNLLAVPFLGVNTDFGGSKYFRGGYAFYIPFGGLATWDRRTPFANAPGTIDSVSRWHNISGQILAIYNTFAFAVKAHERFSIGLNVSPVIHSVKTVRARNGDGSDDTISNGNLVEGRSLLEAHGLNLSAALGVYWEPTDRVKLGLSYTAQPGFGETKMKGTLQTQIAGANPGAPANINFLQTYPDIIRFGVGARATEKLEMRADFEFVRWSVFKNQCVVPEGEKCAVDDDGKAQKVAPGREVILNVPRKWNNAIGVRVGPGYKLTEQLELFGSLGFTTPAVPKETIDASTIDSQRLYATVGARYELSRHLALAGSYNHIHFFPVDTKGANDQNLSAHPSSNPANGDYNASRSPSADGKYKSEIGFVNVNVAYTF